VNAVDDHEAEVEAEYEAQQGAERQLATDDRDGLPADPELVSICLNGPSERIAVETFLNYCPQENDPAALSAARMHKCTPPSDGECPIGGQPCDPTCGSYWSDVTASEEPE